ncbi:MAG: hypothetical protein ABI847_07535 [Anaerolineales bacterium]
MRTIFRLKWLLAAAVIAGAGAAAPTLAQARPSSPPPAAPAGVSVIPETGEAFIHLNHDDNTFGNYTYLDHRALNDNPNAKLLVTNQIYPYSYSAFRADYPLGVFYDDPPGQWAIFNDDQMAMTTAAAWNVFIPPSDSGIMLHTTAAGNVTGTATYINYGLFNGDPNAILFVQHVWNPPGEASSYFTQTVAVAYDTGLAQWKIMTADGTDMPVDKHFFVYAASADELAFQHVTSALNANPPDGTTLDNPALNGNPDVQILVMPNFGTGVTNSLQDRRVGVTYDTLTQKWVIFNENLDPMPVGLMFNVLVIPPKTGAFVHAATTANTLAHISSLSHPDLNNNPYARIYVTHNWNPPESNNQHFNDHRLGVAYNTDHWVIFNRDGSPIPIGSTFNVYYTLPRSNSFVASASAMNSVTTTLTLNNPLLNNQPDAIAITTFTSSPAGQSGTPYVSQVGVHYDSGTTGFWKIFSRLGGDFPVGLSYNVLIPPAASSFIQSTGAGGTTTVLDNPLTNDDPYALVFVTPRDNGDMVAENIGVYYATGRWRIFTESENLMGGGLDFNVFVVKRSALFLPALHR